MPEAHFFLRQFWAVPALDVMGRLEHEATLHVLTTGRSAGTVAVVHRVIDSLATPQDAAGRDPRASRHGKGRRAVRAARAR